MNSSQDRREKLLGVLDREWHSFRESYAGLTDAQLNQPGVIGDWSIKDLIAHIAIWEEEALAHLPVIAEGGRTPRYASVGGIDAFNARKIEATRDLPLIEVRRMAEDAHSSLVAYLGTVPDELLSGTSRFRRRLRLDTYGHYPLHTDAIHAWRGA